VEHIDSAVAETLAGQLPLRHIVALFDYRDGRGLDGCAARGPAASAITASAQQLGIWERRMSAVQYIAIDDDAGLLLDQTQLFCAAGARRSTGCPSIECHRPSR